MPTYIVDLTATYVFSAEIDASSIEDAKDVALENLNVTDEIDVDFLGNMERFDDVRLEDRFGNMGPGSGEAEIDAVEVAAVREKKSS